MDRLADLQTNNRNDKHEECLDLVHPVRVLKTIPGCLIDIRAEYLI
jgi:hypothetical protein